MTDTFYNVPQAKASRLSAAQQRSGARMDGAVVLQSPQPELTNPSPGGGGGLASTASDYGRFLRMMLNGGALDGVRVAKAETVALMGREPYRRTSPCRRSGACCRAAPTSPSSPTAATSSASAS